MLANLEEELPRRNPDALEEVRVLGPKTHGKMGVRVLQDVMPHILLNCCPPHPHA